MIRFTCGGCATGYTVEDSMAGKTSKCPNCWRLVSVPLVQTESHQAIYLKWLEEQEQTAKRQPIDPRLPFAFVGLLLVLLSGAILFFFGSSSPVAKEKKPPAVAEVKQERVVVPIAKADVKQKPKESESTTTAKPKVADKPPKYKESDKTQDNEAAERRKAASQEADAALVKLFKKAEIDGELDIYVKNLKHFIVINKLFSAVPVDKQVVEDMLNEIKDPALLSEKAKTDILRTGGDFIPDGGSKSIMDTGTELLNYMRFERKRKEEK